MIKKIGKFNTESDVFNIFDQNNIKYYDLM